MTAGQPIDRRTAAKARVTAALDLMAAALPDVTAAGVSGFVAVLDQECTTEMLELLAERFMEDAGAGRLRCPCQSCRDGEGRGKGAGGTTQ